MSLLYICLWRCSDGFLFINAGFTNGFSNIEKVILQFFLFVNFFFVNIFLLLTNFENVKKNMAYYI